MTKPFSGAYVLISYIPGTWKVKVADKILLSAFNFNRGVLCGVFSNSNPFVGSQLIHFTVNFIKTGKGRKEQASIKVVQHAGKANVHKIGKGRRHVCNHGALLYDSELLL